MLLFWTATKATAKNTEKQRINKRTQNTFFFIFIIKYWSSDKSGLKCIIYCFNIYKYLLCLFIYWLLVYNNRNIFTRLRYFLSHSLAHSRSFLITNFVDVIQYSITIIYIPWTLFFGWEFLISSWMAIHPFISVLMQIRAVWSFVPGRTIVITHLNAWLISVLHITLALLSSQTRWTWHSTFGYLVQHKEISVVSLPSIRALKWKLVQTLQIEK